MSMWPSKNKSKLPDASPAGRRGFSGLRLFIVLIVLCGVVVGVAIAMRQA